MLSKVLNLGSFATLPQHVVRLIMARDELKADEFSKFQVNKGTDYSPQPLFSQFFNNSRHSKVNQT